MLNEIPNVTWEQARLAVWMQLKRLDEDQKQMASNQSVMQEKIENKFTKDLYEAHSKIRATNKRLDDEENKLTNVRIELAKQAVKMGAITGAISAGATIALTELIRHLLAHPLSASAFGQLSTQAMRMMIF